MNAEFQRNLWLEASPRRIAWAAVTLALVYGAALLATGDAHGGLLGRAAVLGSVGMGVFLVCAVLWGSRAAGGAVLGEIADRTWDFQRLSALTPWAMTWGKLFGATSLAWLCALTGLAMMTLAAAAQHDKAVWWTLIFLVASAVLLQAVCLAAALIGVRKARAEGRSARAGGVMGGLLAATFLLIVISGSAAFRGLDLHVISEAFGGGGVTAWWSFRFPAEAFRAVAVIAFAGWALAAAWRLMRLELQMRNAPVIWPAFLVFLAAFIGGFPAPQSGLTAGLLAGALAVGLAAYAAAFAEPADRVRLRQFVGAAREGDLARALPLIPTPTAPVALAAVLVLAAFLSQPGRPFGAPDWAMGAAMLAFLLRDLGVIAYCRFGGRPQRGDFGAVVALALLYVVGGIVGAQAMGGSGAALFAPSADTPFVSLASGLVQAVVAWAVAGRRIVRPVSASPVAKTTGEGDHAQRGGGGATGLGA